MPDRKDPNDRPQLPNAIGQVQKQLHNQAEAIEAIQEKQGKAVASVQRESLE